MLWRWRLPRGRTCLSCEADCGVCPPSYCDTAQASLYDSCGDACTPLNGGAACQENWSAYRPMTNREWDPATLMRCLKPNGACAEECAASFQCGQGAICLSANGLSATGFCVQTCDLEAGTPCPGGTTCTATNASPTDAACLPGPLCDTTDPAACANGDANVCIQLTPDNGWSVYEWLRCPGALLMRGRRAVYPAGRPRVGNRNMCRICERV